MKALDKFLNNKNEIASLLKNNLKTHLYREKLKRNPPYDEQHLDLEFANTTQLKKSFDRRSKNAVLLPPYSTDCFFRLEDLEPEERRKLAESDFWTYAHEIITTREIMFIHVGSVEKRLTYSSELLTTLTSLPGDIKDVGLKLFRLIFKICRDRERTYLPHLKIRRIIEILFNNPLEVKDECFFQLIKQIRSNPFNGHNYNEWKLMAIVASFVCPSESFLYYFLNYLYSVYQETAVDEIKQWAKYVIKRVLQTNQKSERLVLPCAEELKNIEERRKVPIEIFYPNSSSEIFFFESYTTIGELKTDIIKKYNFDESKTPYYGIYEFCAKEKVYEENYIDDKIKVLDVIGSWSNEIDFLNVKAEKTGESTSVRYRLYFQMRFYFESDLPQINVLKYYQCVYRFMKNRFNIDYETYKKLMALRLRIDFGEPDTSKIDHIMLNFKQESPLLNYESFSSDELNNLKQEVIDEYKGTDLDLYAAQIEFLNICKNNPLYFSELFPVKLYEREDQDNQNLFNLPENLFIALKYDRVYLLNSDFLIIKEFSYSEIMKWGYSSKLFILIITTKEQELPIKVSFKTKMASNIVYTLNSFINIRMGRDPEPNTLNVNENVTREIFKNKFFKKVNVFGKRVMQFEVQA